MKRWRVVLGLVALSALVIYSLRGPLAMTLLGVVLPRMMAADPIGDLPDGLHLTLCGAGSPLPDPKRSGPCVGIVAGGKLFVVDAGSAAARNLNAFGLPAGQVEAVFLTHFHSDHIDGLGELALQRWAGGAAATGPLPLFGPEGVQNIADGFNQAYQADTRYRVAHHGEAVMVPGAAGFSGRTFATPEPGRPTVVWDRDGVKVTSFRVNHAPIDPAVGYRFDYAGRSVVISGDTIRSPEIERMSEGVDLLVHEALAPQLVGMLAQAASDAGLTKRAKIVNDILDYHASPVDAAESAEVAGVGHLLFYHVVPPLLLPGMDAVFLDGVDDAFAGEFTLGQDGTRVSLPAGSTAIEVSGG